MSRMWRHVIAVLVIALLLAGLGSSAGCAKTEQGSASTSTMLTSSKNPSTYGDPVTFTATISSTTGTDIPTGTVTFKDGASTLETATLSSGQATYATSTLSAGSHSITAVYGGDANFAGSSSAALTQTVNQASTTMSGWTSQNPSFPTNYLTGVWGSSASDVFAVGDNGTILHYNGNAWSPMSIPTSGSLCDVWGSSASDVFVVGGYPGGIILHYDGSAWSAMSSGTTNTLWDVWGSGSSDVFAVGDNGTILHYNGSAWSTMSTSSSGMTNGLTGVWGSSASDVFAVGYAGRSFHHYDGSTWTEMDSTGIESYSGTFNGLTGVWGSSASDVFAVGGSPAVGGNGRVNGTILHYAG